MDCPGQVELFTLHESLLNIVQTMTDKWHIRWGIMEYHPATLHFLHHPAPARSQFR